MRESAGLTAVLTVVELLGLLLVIFVGFPPIEIIRPKLVEMLPAGSTAWSGVTLGAFLAFFAYIGFESLANMAEKAQHPKRDVPRAIIPSIAVSGVLYALVAFVVVASIPVEQLVATNAPLALVMAESGWTSPIYFLVIALVTILNGLLADLSMTARLMYGMAKRGIAPAWLSQVSPTRQTPIIATLFAGAGTLVFAVAVPFEHLVSMTSTATILVFLLVNLALWRLRLADGEHTGIWVPPRMALMAALLCLALLSAQVSLWWRLLME